MSEQLYRDQGKQAAHVICPSCQKPVVIDSVTATCSHCAHVFVTKTATSLVEYNATQNLALVLRDDKPPARNDALIRWGGAAGVLAFLVGGGLVFGATGIWVGAVLGAGLLLAATTR